MARIAIRLTGASAEQLGPPVVIDEAGGWIGRAPDNEVAIEDPTRVVSSRHARIDWDGDAFGLTDQSMNGTDLNGRRMTRAERVPLHSGDEIRIGPFRMQVLQPNEAPSAATTADPMERPGSAQPDPTGRFTLSLDDLIGPNAPPQLAPPPRAMPSFGDAPTTRITLPPVFETAAPAPEPAYEPPPAPVPPPYSPPPYSPPPYSPPPDLPPPPLAAPDPAPASTPARWLAGADQTDPAALLAAFWRGLGIGAPNAPTPAMMEEIGLAMHEALVGVGAMAGADGRENPLANGVRDIRRHLGAPQPRLAEHVRAAFAAGQARVAAVTAAVGAAATGLADSLSARAIEQRLAGTVNKRMSVFRRAELWRQFRALEGEVRDAALHRFHQDLGHRLESQEPRQLPPRDLGGA